MPLSILFATREKCSSSYHFLAPARWSAYGSWSRCSTSCGTGTQSRRRTCHASPCGGRCVGPAAETRSCGTAVGKKLSKFAKKSAKKVVLFENRLFFAKLRKDQTVRNYEPSKASSYYDTQ